MSGSVVLVGTPIGNLGDLSPRAVEALRTADVIACEDSRRTGRLLAHAGIAHRGLVVLNKFTERRVAVELVARAVSGEMIAVVTDAGMPVVSDPGAGVVELAAAADVEVRTVPGPSAVTSALAMSGIDATRFAFEGFIPRKGRERSERLDELAEERRTMVLYEAPHRIEALIRDLGARLGFERPAAIAREMTKLHEEVVRGTLGALAETACVVAPRGEYVVVVAGRPPGEAADDATLVGALEALLAGGSTRRDAIEAVTARHGVPRKRVYGLAVGLVDP